MDNDKVSDFKVGDYVKHLFWARYGFVTKVGGKFLQVQVDGDPTLTLAWLPTSVRHVLDGE